MAETFWEAVYRLRQQHHIPKQWSRADLHHWLADEFAESTISTVPSNQSMTKDGSKVGDYVKKRQEPKAWRVSRGVFELIDDPG